MKDLPEYINACCTGIWVHTREPDEAQRDILKMAASHQWRVLLWDLARGITQPDGVQLPGGTDPIAALGALGAVADPQTSTLLVLHNFHRCMGNPELVQATINQLLQGKQQRTFLVALAPTVQLPLELEKLFVVLEHELPTRAELAAIADSLLSGEALPSEGIDAAVGLTCGEAEGAFALSLARHGRLQPSVIWELKAQSLRKNSVLTLHRGGERFDGLGGLAALKDFTRRALRPGAAVQARGVLLLGVPGTGKSAFAKALGTETGRPTLLFDVGALFGSLVGQTEAATRQALRAADAMAPAVIFIDEIDKALTGVGSQGDSGVSARLFGTFLSWLNDHTSDVFTIATCNNIQALPPEFSRAERWDGVYFLDLPQAPEKDAIWNLYRQQFGIPPDQPRPDDTDWTGAEIKACCRLAALLDLPLKEAAKNVVPVARTAAESVDRLRAWASGRCLDASRPGIYQKSTDNLTAPPALRQIKKAQAN
jgi:hypothetical protein